jgi:hypothetical protein
MTDPRKPKEPDERMTGTRVIPQPEETPTVAGMPRKGRKLEEPGDPGIITPANDVYAGKNTDLSRDKK